MREYQFCTECGTRNPVGRAECYNCNGPVGTRQAEIRREKEQINELRELNGKEPLYDLPNIDDDAEPPDEPLGAFVLIFLLVVFLALIIALIYTGTT